MAELAGFEEFYAGAYRRVVGQVFALLGDLAEAEDVTQDAVAKASLHWGRIAASDQPEAWVRRVAFVARFADSNREPGRYRLVDVDPRTGKLTASAVVLATDPSPNRRVGVGRLELDASGRYLLYAVEGTFLRTSWVDLGGKRARVIVGQFNALDPKETHAYKAGAW